MLGTAVEVGSEQEENWNSVLRTVPQSELCHGLSRALQGVQGQNASHGLAEDTGCGPTPEVAPLAAPYGANGRARKNPAILGHLLHPCPCLEAAAAAARAPTHVAVESACDHDKAQTAGDQAGRSVDASPMQNQPLTAATPDNQAELHQVGDQQHDAEMQDDCHSPDGKWRRTHPNVVDSRRATVVAVRLDSTQKEHVLD